VGEVLTDGDGVGFVYCRVGEMVKDGEEVDATLGLSVGAVVGFQVGVFVDRGSVDGEIEGCSDGFGVEHALPQFESLKELHVPLVPPSHQKHTPHPMLLIQALMHVLQSADACVQEVYARQQLM
jgi:hypothetical protein